MRPSQGKTASLVAPLVLALFAAGVSAAGAARPQSGRTGDVSDTVTRTVDVGTTGALDLSNVVGDITVTAGEGRTTTIEITRRSQARTDADARTGLTRVTVQVEARADRARVSTLYPDQHTPYSVTVAYRVTAPPGVHVTVRTTAGNVTITGIKGDLEAHAITGAIVIGHAGPVTDVRTVSGSIALSDVSSDRQMTLGTIAGSISLDRVTARRIAADTIAGDIRAHDVSCEGAVFSTLSGHLDYQGAVADGGRYELSSHSGIVHFEPAGGHGFDLQVTTFAGHVEIDPALKSTTTTAGRRSVHAVIGDGAGAVVVQTFSGNVEIGNVGRR